MNPICFALDVPFFCEAQALVEELDDYVGAYKIGLELFISAGRLPLTKRPIVLDLKLHDIPETVARAVSAAARTGAAYTTIHIQQTAAMHGAAKVAAGLGIKLLGVTVLTSMTDRDSLEMYGRVVSEAVLYRARMGWDYGLRGFVCSPQEVDILYKEFKGEAFLLVPGVRPEGGVLADQARVGTPRQAIKDGANLIVVGRPIRDAPDRRAAALAIRKETHGS